MKFKSALVTTASGSIGGMTASRNRGGMYLRGIGNPTNPNTPQQQEIRGILGTLSQRWQTTLTDAQREAWRTYATNVSVTDVFGDSRNLSGQQMYVRSNTPRLQAGLAAVDDGPTEFNLGEAPVLTINAFEADGTGWTADISYPAADNSWTSIDDANLLIYGSRERAPSQIYFKGPYRYAALVAGNSTTPPTTGIEDTLFPGTAGNIATIQARVTYPDGRLSSAVQYTSTLV